MTETTVSTTTSTAPPSFWEDLIDIFFAPAGVFRRWENKSVWPALLFVSVAVGVIFFATFNTLEPIFEAEFMRGIAKATARGGPAQNPEMIAKMRNFGLASTQYGMTVMMLLTVFGLGNVSWVMSKLIGSKQSYHAALVVAAWAYMPRVIGAVLGGVQGLLMDPSKLNSAFSISIGPARFFDVETTNPLLYQFLGRLDLITIWVTVLLAIGLYVTGKVSKKNAIVFGLLIWFVGGIPAFRTGYLAM